MTEAGARRCQWQLGAPSRQGRKQPRVTNQQPRPLAGEHTDHTSSQRPPRDTSNTADRAATQQTEKREQPPPKQGQSTDFSTSASAHHQQDVHQDDQGFRRERQAPGGNESGRCPLRQAFASDCGQAELHYSIDRSREGVWLADGARSGVSRVRHEGCRGGDEEAEL